MLIIISISISSLDPPSPPPPPPFSIIIKSIPLFFAKALITAACIGLNTACIPPNRPSFSPSNIPACTAHPSATASSGWTVRCGTIPATASSNLAMTGMRVAPPTRTMRDRGRPWMPSWTRSLPTETLVGDGCEPAELTPPLRWLPLSSCVPSNDAVVASSMADCFCFRKDRSRLSISLAFFRPRCCAFFWALMSIICICSKASSGKDSSSSSSPFPAEDDE
mmetsp:Transcript_2446/g.4524  ORF Transcript_2446/g.4524 Transcript_2446/m.4524 type:complete len:222 (+) Transcript_2446:172-837(+)